MFFMADGYGKRKGGKKRGQRKDGSIPPVEWSAGIAEAAADAKKDDCPYLIFFCSAEVAKFAGTGSKAVEKYSKTVTKMPPHTAFESSQVVDTLDAVAYPFLDNELVVVAHPDHPLVGTQNITLQRLSKERFLMREPGSGTRLAVDKLFSGQDLKIETYMELGSSESIKQGVLAGLGVSVMALHNLRVELAGGHVAVLPVEGFPLQRQWYAVHLKSKRLSIQLRQQHVQ